MVNTTNNPKVIKRQREGYIKSIQQNLTIVANISPTMISDAIPAGMKCRQQDVCTVNTAYLDVLQLTIKMFTIIDCPDFERIQISIQNIKFDRNKPAETIPKLESIIVGAQSDRSAVQIAIETAWNLRAGHEHEFEQFLAHLRSTSSNMSAPVHAPATNVLVSTSNISIPVSAPALNMSSPVPTPTASETRKRKLVDYDSDDESKFMLKEALK